MTSAESDAGLDQMYHLGCPVREGEDGIVALAGREGDPVHADGPPAAVGELDRLQEASVTSSLGYGALTNVAAFDELFNGRGWARERVASLDEVACLRGDPVARQHTRLVVVDDFLDAGRWVDDLVNSPDATVLAVGHGE